MLNFLWEVFFPSLSFATPFSNLFFVTVCQHNPSMNKTYTYKYCRFCVSLVTLRCREGEHWRSKHETATSQTIQCVNSQTDLGSVGAFLADLWFKHFRRRTLTDIFGQKVQVLALRWQQRSQTTKRDCLLLPGVITDIIFQQPCFADCRPSRREISWISISRTCESCTRQAEIRWSQGSSGDGLWTTLPPHESLQFRPVSCCGTCPESPWIFQMCEGYGRTFFSLLECRLYFQWTQESAFLFREVPRVPQCRTPWSQLHRPESQFRICAAEKRWSWKSDLGSRRTVESPSQWFLSRSHLDPLSHWESAQRHCTLLDILQMCASPCWCTPEWLLIRGLSCRLWRGIWTWTWPLLFSDVYLPLASISIFSFAPLFSVACSQNIWVLVLANSCSSNRLSCTRETGPDVPYLCLIIFCSSGE